MGSSRKTEKNGQRNCRETVKKCTVWAPINSNDFGRFWTYLADSNSNFVVVEIVRKIVRKCVDDARMTFADSST